MNPTERNPMTTRWIHTAEGKRAMTAEEIEWFDRERKLEMADDAREADDE